MPLVLPWELTAREILKQLNIELVPAFERPFFDEVRFKLVMAGERAGKSFTGGTYAAARHIYQLYTTGSTPQLIWLVGKDYESCVPEFNQLAEELVTLELLNPKSIYVRDAGRDKCFFTTESGLHVETITGADPQKVARLAPDGVLGCEVAQWSYELFQRVMGRLAEKRGWLYASGSFEGSIGWLPKTWRMWQGDEPDARSYSIPSWANTHLFPAGYDDPEMVRLRAIMTEQRFKERHAGVPAPPTGAVYASEVQPERITKDAIYSADYPVYIFVDPGYAGAYAVLVVQRKGDYLDIVDEIYERGHTHSEVIEIAQQRPWWAELKRSHGVIDVAAHQHQADRSAIEVWEAAGVRMSSNKIRIVDGIERVLSFLRSTDPKLTGLPYLRINPKCGGLLAEMGLSAPIFEDMQPYSRKTDSQGIALSDLPEPKNNHACSALAYGLIDMFGYVNPPPPPGAPVYWTQVAGGVSWMDTKSSKKRLELPWR